jgi:primosomal replication protein N
MRSEWKENQGRLVGTVEKAPEFSHENHGEDYFRLTLGVPRLSGVVDTLPVMVGRTLLESCPATLGDRVEVVGEVRSHNNRTGQGNRLQIFLFAHHLALTEDSPRNEITLSGSLCRTPVYRRTPMGREICDLLLAVNRRYGQSDYLPCIAWGSLARQCREKDVGERLAFRGRLQSRNYRKLVDGVEEEKTAFEVSMMEMLHDDEI